MKELDIVVWVILALALAWGAADHINANRPEECQAYDRLGHGIGCEGWDISDR